VLAVGPGDIGSSFDAATRKWNSGGNPPTLEACEESIQLRAPSNEWFVRGYVPIGIFVLPPLFARKAIDLDGSKYYGDAEIDLSEVVNAFHDMPVFSATDLVFKEYNRSGHGWLNVNYDKIIPPR
jgi:hypothetical protein